MNIYKVAMQGKQESGYPKLKVLDTGKWYSRGAAMDKAEELNKTCQEELKALDYDSFVAYSVYSE